LAAESVPNKWLRRFGRSPSGRLTLRTRIAIHLAVAILPLCLAAEIAQYSNALHNRSLRESALVSRGEAILARQSSALQELNILLETISALPLGNPSNSNVCDETFRRIVLQNRKISSLHLIALDGETVCRTPQLRPGADGDMQDKWFERAIEVQQFAIWAPPPATGTEKDADQNRELIATLPIYDADRRAIGILGAKVPSRSLTLSIQETDLPDASAVAILDAKGTILAQRAKGVPVDEWLPAARSREADAGLMSGAYVLTGLDSIKRTYVVVALPGNIFGIYAQDAEELSSAARALLYFIIAFPLLIWIVASVTAGRATERIVIEPLNNVRQAIRRYIAGDDTARVERDTNAPEEVQAVATKFNTMADTIQARDEALRAALDHQKALVREINHRVRNNLQVMNSLLNLQSRRAKTPEQAAIFLDVQRRLNALGIVHAAFYQGDDFRSVDLSILLKDLCQSTERHLSSEWGRPVLSMHCPSPVFARPDAALTLAFLVTELIADATSRLSPEGHPATQIDFDLAEQPRGGSILTMKVDQPVLADLMENRPDEGHINLFRGLIRQLRAHMDVDEPGCVVTVSLPVLV